MSVNVGWEEVAVRLLLTIVAGGLIGLDRGEHGRPAGLRTTILVCLAASVSMIQANLLLPLAGKQPDSFVVLDLMRLPLGILSGMGFIGGGAILRRGNLVTGVTTAATLWFVTVMGLCFGGGQLLLGLAMLVVGMLTLSVLKWGENRMPQDRRAVLSLITEANGPSEEDVRQALLASQMNILAFGVTFGRERHLRRVRCELTWRGLRHDSRTPASVERLAAMPGVARLTWKPA